MSNEIYIKKIFVKDDFCQVKFMWKISLINFFLTINYDLCKR